MGLSESELENLVRKPHDAAFGPEGYRLRLLRFNESPSAAWFGLETADGGTFTGSSGAFVCGETKEVVVLGSGDPLGSVLIERHSQGWRPEGPMVPPQGMDPFQFSFTIPESMLARLKIRIWIKTEFGFWVGGLTSDVLWINVYELETETTPLIYRIDLMQLGQDVSVKTAWLNRPYRIPPYPNAQSASTVLRHILQEVIPDV